MVVDGLSTFIYDNFYFFVVNGGPWELVMALFKVILETHNWEIHRGYSSFCWESLNKFLSKNWMMRNVTGSPYISNHKRHVFAGQSVDFDKYTPRFVLG